MTCFDNRQECLSEVYQDPSVVLLSGSEGTSARSSPRLFHPRARPRLIVGCQRASLHADWLPQTSSTRTMEGSHVHAKARPRARVKTGIVLAGILGLVILSSPCGARASAVPVTLSPASASFGNVAISTASNPLNFTLADNQSVTLNIATVTLSNADFAGTSTTCGSSLAAGASCTITVTFTPSTLTTETAILTVNDDAPSPYNSVTSSLSGTGVGLVTLTPASVSFGLVAVNTGSNVRTFTLWNYQAVALNISSITFTGANAGDFSQTNTCGAPPTNLAAGTSCTLSVTFTPSTLTAETATLTVNDNAVAPYNTLTSALSGSGVQDATLTPGIHNFGNVVPFTTSSATIFTLHNSELMALSISSIGFTGTNAGDFSQTNTCGSSLASSASCTISVTLTPSVLGAETATLNVNESAVAPYNTLTSPLSGSGTGPVDGLTPAGISFGSQPVGTTSAAQTATMTNSGNGALNLSAVVIVGINASDFAQTNTCSTSVSPRGSCTVNVTFTPTASGTRTASLAFTDNAAGSPQTVSLSGTGMAPGVSLSASSVAFGNQLVSTTSAAQTVTLTNSGNAALSITGMAITGTNASAFAQTNTCGSSVAAGGTCTISVTFTPTASGSDTASLSITDNASGSPQGVGLSGTGTAAVASLSATSLAFGNEPIDITSSAQSVTLSNTGSAALSIASLALTGANASDFAQSDACGSSLAAGANCTIAVMFTPSLAAAEAATLSITDNASGSPQAVSLSGTGTHDVILSWTASPTSGVVGYNVYRGTTSGGPYSTLLNATPVNGTTYTDATVQAGQTYYYVVTAVGSDGVTQSVDSSPASATVP